MSSTWPVDIFGLTRRMTSSCPTVGGRFELESHPRAICPPVRVGTVGPENSTGNVDAAYRDRFHECRSLRFVRPLARAPVRWRAYRCECGRPEPSRDAQLKNSVPQSNPKWLWDPATVLTFGDRPRSRCRHRAPYRACGYARRCDR